MFLKVWDIVHWKDILVYHWNKTVFTVLVSKYCGPIEVIDTRNINPYALSFPRNFLCYRVRWV